MAVLSVFSWTVKPGRTQEVLGIVAQARKIHERLGAQVRVLLPQYSSTPGSLTYILEHDSMTAHGVFSDKLQSDQEWQAVFAQIQTNTDPSAELSQASLLMDAP